MLTDPIALTGNGAAENFARVGTSGTSATYSVLARPNDETNKLTISHQEVGSGSLIRRRSLVRLDEPVLLTDGVTYGVSSIQVVIDNPVKQADDTVVLEALAKIVNFLDVAANAQAIVDGQI